MKYLSNHSEVSPLSDELILIPCLLKSNQGDGDLHQKCRIKCQGLQDPVYGGKNSLVLRSEYEVLKRKNT